MACSPDLIDVRKCTVPTSQCSTSLNPAVVGCSFKQLLCDADPGFSHQQYLTDDEQIYVQWEDDNRGMTKKSLSAPSPERSFVSHCSLALLVSLLWGRHCHKRNIQHVRTGLLRAPALRACQHTHEIAATGAVPEAEA